jgi:branched-chain amino acid transport system substrate-binding protein
MTSRIFVTVALSLSLLLGCQQDEAVKIGAVLPLTGEYEIYGQAIRKGVDLAYEHLQADGSLPYKVEVTVLDSEGDPAKAAELAEQLYDDGALAVVGGVVTAEALQMVPVADRADRVLLSPSASNPQLTGISKNFYRVFPSDSREGTTMGNFAAGKLEVQTMVILTKEDEYARGNQEVFQSEFERNGGQVLEVIEYPPGAADFSGFVDRVMTLDPQAVYVAAYAGDISKMIKELRQRGFQGSILTTSAFASPEIIELVGEAAEGVFLTQAVFEVKSEEPKIKEFVDAFQAKYSLTPDLYAAHGYDSVMVLAEARKEGGEIEADFWRDVRGLRAYPGVTGTIQFDERGDAQKFPRVYVVEAGNLVDYEKEVQRRKEELLKRLKELQERQRQRAGGG